MKFLFSYILMLLLLMAACTTTSTVQNGAYKYLYDYESHELHPEYVIYHFSDDSSTVFFRIPSTELLYARSNAEAPFLAHLDLHSTITNADNTVADTMNVQITDVAKGLKGWLIGQFNIKLTAGAWNMLIEFNDLTKKTSQSSYIKVDKTSRYTAQNYLVKKFDTGEPIFGGFVAPSEYVEILSARNQNEKSISVYHLAADIKLPPPPFSSNMPEMPDVTQMTPKQEPFAGETSYIFEVESGDYFISNDMFKKNGVTLKTANDYFPFVKSNDALQWPLRYITTKSEFDQIVKNSYPKQMIDNFWVECAGSKEHAPRLDTHLLPPRARGQSILQHLHRRMAHRPRYDTRGVWQSY